MSHILNLVDGLLATARHLREHGQKQAALDILKRLARFRNLAPDIAEEVHAGLADLYAESQQYKNARRHLTIALTHRPQHAEYHYRMAIWIEDDPDAASGRADRYFHCALDRDPENADYLVDYGAYLVGVGRKQAARRMLLRALPLASHDADLVGRIAAGLRDAGFWDDARAALRRAMFARAGDRRFRVLWQQHQFAQLCRRQQASDEAPAAAPRVGRAVVLPFLRTKGTSNPLVMEGKIIRIDRGTDPVTCLPLPKRPARAPRKRGAK